MIDLNPLHYVFNWTAVGSGVVALIAGHYHGKYNLSGRAWEKIKTVVKTIFTSKKAKDIADLKNELAALKAKLTPPA